MSRFRDLLKLFQNIFQPREGSTDRKEELGDSRRKKGNVSGWKSLCVMETLLEGKRRCLWMGKSLYNILQEGLK